MADGEITFEIPFALPSLNTVMRMHWSEKKRLRASIAKHIMIQTVSRRPSQPWAKATVRIERHAARQLDDDNMVGAGKVVLDCLQPPSLRHPSGLGIIVNDSPDCVQVEYLAVKVKGVDAKTIVIVRSA